VVGSRQCRCSSNHITPITQTALQYVLEMLDNCFDPALCCIVITPASRVCSVKWQPPSAIQQ
jgi:hypothetical protein